MKIQLSQIGCTVLLMLAAFTGVQQTEAQNANPFFNTFLVQGVLTSDDWGPNPGPMDGTSPRFDVVPIIVHNCAPIPCPDTVLGTTTVTLGQGGVFTMPIVIPENLLADAGALSLKFAVRTNGGGEFTTLSGTLPLTATPYATVAQSVIGPIPASSLTGQMPTGMLTGVFSTALSLSNPGNIFAGDGSLLAHVNATTIGGRDACDLPCYWKTNGNGGTTLDSFLGTTDNMPLTIKVNKYPALRVFPANPDRSDIGSAPLELAPELPNIVGGFGDNTISTDARGATIAGGGSRFDHVFHSVSLSGKNEIGQAGDFSFIGSGTANYVKGPHNSIVGGHYNKIIDGNYCLIAGGGENLITAPVDGGAIVGGYQNSVTGNTDTNMPSGDLAFIGAGHNNTATNFAAFIGGGGNNLAGGAYSVVAGGAKNRNSGEWATIGGGYGNVVTSGIGATVPGGEENTAAAAGTFAAGTRAIAAHEGSFALSDRQPGYFSTDRTNQFAVRAQNGVMIQGAATVLDLRGDGAIRVAGAGVGSRGPVFIHRATADNISGHITTIDHPLANGDPNAILLVTHNFSADTSGTRYEPSTVGVWYNGSQWTIYHENTSIAMPAGRAFNVMIIKP